MRTLKNTQGFSLVELMVVVAIIGILATMSVGAIQKQIAKARQTEVKTNLSSLYTAQKTFHAEFNSYYSNMQTIRFNLEGNLRYNIGTGSGGAPSGYPAALPANTDNNTAAKLCTSTGTCTLLPEAFADTEIPSPATANDTFTAVGGGRVYKGADDVWSMNENKNLVLVTDGLAN
ncbi:MAG: prepilin-type N-terminal cleavage/methylation domain-containing protein [Proteobacteria bacterium]|jgi:type IV pilus assembly protein PilA|nr:prepilin-type N-terminal cleavage/methylation domain-containing protein [Pseudomonadota bacterium]